MNVRDYLEHLKAKPEHQRQSIAFSVAGAFTLVVMIGWATTIVGSGVLALDEVPEQTVELGAAAKDVSKGFSGLAGAAAALEFSEEKGSITVVETQASSTLDEVDQSEATVIPF